MPEHAERSARLWLALADGVTGKARSAVLHRFGSYHEAYLAFPKGFNSLVGPKAYKELMQLKAAGPERLAGRLKELDIQVAYLGDDTHYPSVLSCITDAPDVLFFRGTLQASERRSVAIVGSRRETRYGRRMASNMARELAQQGVTVVSGLARGIDTAAHLGSLEGGGPTIAVLGSGLSRLYPEENADLAQRIIENGGAVVTECPPNTEPKPFRFPARNRIVSGLAHALIIVEAREKSGTLITVGHALEQGREVFAVPGEVDAPGSAVPFQLMRDGAHLCTSAQHLMEDMGWEVGRRVSGEPTNMQLSLDNAQAAIWAALEVEALGFDDLLLATTLSTSELNTQLTLMELSGLIEALPGRMFGRTPG